MKKAIEAVKKFINDEEGLSAVEYAIAGALVIGVAAGAFVTLGSNVNTQVDTLASCVLGDGACAGTGGTGGTGGPGGTGGTGGTGTP